MLSAPTRCAAHTPIAFQFNTHPTKNLASSLRRTNSALLRLHTIISFGVCARTHSWVFCVASGARVSVCDAAAATTHSHAFGVTTTTSRRKHITTLIHDYTRAATASDVGRRSEHSLCPASTAGINNNNGSQQQHTCACVLMLLLLVACAYAHSMNASPFGRAGNEWRAVIVYRSATNTRSIHAAVYTHTYNFTHNWQHNIVICLCFKLNSWYSETILRNIISNI